MAPPAHEFRFRDAEAARAACCMQHHGPGGVHKGEPADNCLMRLSPSGMNRRNSSGELDVNGPLHAARDSPASRSGSLTAASRFQRTNGSSGNGLSALGGAERSDSGAYRGPFGHVGDDPDQDFAAVTIEHGPHDDE